MTATAQAVEPVPPLLAVDGLTLQLRRRRDSVALVDGVSFTVAPGEAVGLVGESGCGKSVTALAAIGLLPRDKIRASAGAIRFEDADLLRLDDRAARQETVARMLESVGLAAGEAAKFPHQFSGGQRQRLAIARAAILDPALIIADEPVSALDVSIRSQVLNLLADLRRDRRMALILIAHDLAVVGHVCDRIAVMYLGRIVEEGPSDDLLTAPAHPYTRALVGSVYHLKGGATAPQRVLEGDPPDPSAPPPGCPFHPRCPAAMDRCRAELPALVARQTENGPRRTACHLHPPAVADDRAA